MFTLPSSLFVSTFPPSAAFFDESNGGELSGGGGVNSGSNDGHSVLIDMGDADDSARPSSRETGVNIPTSVLARVFDATTVAASSAPLVIGASSSSSGTSLKNGTNSLLTPEQENLLKLYGGCDPGSPSTLNGHHPDVFPCSSSSSSSSEANEANLQYYKCRRCRLQCVTTEKWTQTPLAPIYGGNGSPRKISTSSKEVEEEAPASLPLHLQTGWKSGNFKSSLFASNFTLLPPLPAAPTSASSAPNRGQLPHASTFPDLG